MRCVEKDPRRRVADLSTALFVLDEPPLPGTAVPVPQPVPSRWRVAGYAAAALAGAALTALATSVAMRRTPPPTIQPVRFAIVPPSAQFLQISSFDRDLAIAPDGTRIVVRRGREAETVDAPYIPMDWRACPLLPLTTLVVSRFRRSSHRTVSGLDSSTIHAMDQFSRRSRSLEGLRSRCARLLDSLAAPAGDRTARSSSRRATARLDCSVFLPAAESRLC